ncbi:RNA-binding protein [Bacillus sp. UMB0899]|uniref:YlmH family RNA-binding protein n=1 Tax=Metabacillus schmidteae TaxID=2730405 RepID=UPI000C80D552|nr:RNA-binding protein [Metabacillus schmidteae]PMC38359.1 RNA-binding protein [Bacillus sp. UMB0899]
MNQIYQHFRHEERQFIDQVIEWKENVLNQYSPKLTDFLDPREQEIVSSVIGEHLDVRVTFSGGVDDTERKRALLYPDYYEVKEEDFQLALFEVQYASKFITLQHRQVLGSLMSLGLKRNKFGDIRFYNDMVHFICASEISDYLFANFNEIGRAKISLKNLDVHSFIPNKEDVQEMVTTVSSLRLDVVGAAIYNLSRQKIQPLITNGHVKVNWKVVDSASFECREGDTLSIRGYGRSKLTSIEGRTKKDRVRVVISKQK